MSGLKQAVWHLCWGNGGCYLDWADHWQTMITGVMAVGAAAWAALSARHQLRIGRDQVMVARDQIQAALDDAQDRRRRALRASRATLPSVLSGICEYAGGVAKELAAHLPFIAGVSAQSPSMEEARTLKVDVPIFPPSFVAPLQDILVHLDDDAVHDRIASIFREAQVLEARTRPFAVGQEIFADWLEGIILQAVALYVRAESLFEFARGESDTVDDDLWPRMFVVLNILNIRDPSIKLQAEYERKNGQRPGEGDSLFLDDQPSPDDEA